MIEFASFRSVIELWPTREAMASDIGASASSVSKWWQRDSLPSEWWEAVLATEAASAAGLKAITLAALASRGRRELALAEARP